MELTQEIPDKPTITLSVVCDKYKLGTMSKYKLGTISALEINDERFNAKKDQEFRQEMTDK